MIKSTVVASCVVWDAADRPDVLPTSTGLGLFTCHRYWLPTTRYNPLYTVGVACTVHCICTLNGVCCTLNERLCHAGPAHFVPCRKPPTFAPGSATVTCGDDAHHPTGTACDVTCYNGYMATPNTTTCTAGVWDAVNCTGERMLLCSHCSATE